LLTDWFGFDELELQLLGLAPNPDKRRELRNGIAKLVETGGADPAFYASLTNQIEEQRRNDQNIKRFQRIGLAVQDAVKQALENCGLSLTLVDRGFDYESLRAPKRSLRMWPRRFRSVRISWKSRQPQRDGRG
jgi:hypothetical protein